MAPKHFHILAEGWSEYLQTLLDASDLSNRSRSRYPRLSVLVNGSLMEKLLAFSVDKIQ